MTVKNHYFVTIDTHEIRDISIPDSGIEFEVIADQNEINKLRKLFMTTEKHEKNALEYLAKPFDEWGADDERQWYAEYVKAIYQAIFNLGTDDTKHKIKQLGIIK